jgi:hypothetical protein
MGFQKTKRPTNKKKKKKKKTIHSHMPADPIKW